MKKIFRYTFEKLKLNKRNVILIGGIFLLAIIIYIILFCIQPSFNLEKVSFDREALLSYYREQIVIYQNGLNEEGLTSDDINFLQTKINEYSLYIRTNTCEFDYISLTNMTTKYVGQEARAFSVLYLYRFNYLMITLSILLGVSSSYEVIKYKMLLSGDVTVKDIYHGKNIINMIIICLLPIINFVVLLFININSLNTLFLIQNHQYFNSTNLFTIILTSCLSSLILSLFIYLFSLIIGYFLKNKMLSFIISFALIILTIFINFSLYSNFKDIFALEYLPLFNLMNLGFYGKTLSLIINYVIYIFIIVGLYLFGYRIFKKVVR